MTTVNHTHRWVLESSAPKDVAGTCECGATKVFTGGGSENPYEAYRKTNTRYHKAYDDDGLRPSDLAHFIQSNYEAM